MTKSFKKYFYNLDEAEGSYFDFNPTRKGKDSSGKEVERKQMIHSNSGNIKYAKTVIDRLIKSPKLIEWFKNSSRDGAKQLSDRATTTDTKNVLSAIGILMHVANVGKIGEKPIVGSPVTKKQAKELLMKIGISEEEIEAGKKTKNNILIAGIENIANKEKERPIFKLEEPEEPEEEPGEESEEEPGEESEEEPEEEPEEPEEEEPGEEPEEEPEKKIDDTKLTKTQKQVFSYSNEKIKKWKNLEKSSRNIENADQEERKYWKNVDDYVNRHFGPKDISKVGIEEKKELDKMKIKAREIISALIRDVIKKVNKKTKEASLSKKEVDLENLKVDLDTHETEIDTAIYPDKLGRTLRNFRKIGRGVKRIGRGIKKFLGKEEVKTAGKELVKRAKETGKEIADKTKKTFEKVKSSLKAGKETGEKAKIVRNYVPSKFEKYRKLIKQGNVEAAEQIYKHAQRIADVRSKKFLPPIKENFEMTSIKAKAIKEAETKIIKNIIRH